MNSNHKESVLSSHDIFSAVLESKEDVLKTLIQGSKDILEERTKLEKWTPLHIAVISSNQPIVELLLQQGADPYLKDNDGRIPLHWAGHRNVSFSVFEALLIKSIQSIETNDVYDRTPMHYICMNQTTSNNEDVEMCDIHDAIQKLHSLFKYVRNIDSLDYEGNTSLHLLCEHIHNGAQPEEINLTLVPEDIRHLKSKSVCGFILEMFLCHNANTSIPNEYGITALHLACQWFCTEMIELLITQNSNLYPNAKWCDILPMSMIFTHSPVSCKCLPYQSQQSDWLFLSDYKYRFENSLRPVLRSMKVKSLNVNYQNRLSGSTALHHAVGNLKCSSNVVKGLVEYAKAEVNVQNILGKTPLHFARQDEIRVPRKMKEILVKNWREKLDILLQHGANVNCKDLFGFTPLHDAALHGELDFMEYLIEHNANVLSQNKHGATPLHLLSLSRKDDLHSYEDIFEPLLNLLLKAGVDINGQDVYGSSALHYAIHVGNKNMITKLLEHGIRTDLRDENGLNPLELCYTIHSMEVETLLSKRADEADIFTGVVQMKNAEEWLTSNISDKALSNEKITSLLQPTWTSSMSNDISQNCVLNQILNLMRSIFNEIERRDNRFKVTIELSGSTREGTKVDSPDEFDILCFLDNFESLCNIEEQPNTEFIRCRRDKTIKSESFNEFFEKNDCLNGSRISTVFYRYIKECLGNPSVWISASGLILDEESETPSAADLPDILCLNFRYSDSTYKYLPVSCDIVPVIRQKRWWPSFARQKGGLNTSSIIENGCMILIVPRKYDTLSGERVRILTELKVSVYLSECIVMQSLPRPIIEAYKLAKILTRRKNLYPALTDISEKEVKEYEEQGMDLFLSAIHPAMENSLIIFTSYELKNALFYALDEEQPLSTSDIPDLEITRKWTAGIFKRLQRLITDCHFPAYFLPTQQIRKYMERNSNTKIECMFCKIIAAIAEGTLNNHHNVS